MTNRRPPVPTACGFARPSSGASSFRIPHSPFRIRRALTLIEMLVALAVTMVMMAAVVNLFANISGSIRNRRAVIEVSGQLRQVRMRLAKDLAGATCEATTWQRPEENRGYIEIVEGLHSDKWPSNLVDGDNSNGEIDGAISILPSAQTVNTNLGSVTDGYALGDFDDILALTVRSEAEPFVAEVDNQTVTSNLAEVVWYAFEDQQSENPPGTFDPKANDGIRMIFRRVLLIAPWLGPWDDRPANVSARRVTETVNGNPVTRWVANTLGDLTKRENRISRQPADQFPFPLDRGNLGGQNPEYLMLDDALAFDVRVFDPDAPLYALQTSPNTVMEPSDRGWELAAQQDDPVGYGAFCDLGWNRNYSDPSPGPYNMTLPNPPLRSVFQHPRMAGWHPNRPPADFFGHPAVYDTWSYHYENDSVDQYNDSVAGNNLTDRGTNGIDDDNQNGVDDLGERETFPPYNVPLRGVKVVLRIYERDARQTREVSVTHSF